MVDLTLIDQDGKPAGRVQLTGHIVTEEQFKVLLNFGKEKKALQERLEQLEAMPGRKEEAEIRAECDRLIRLANDRADKATQRAAEVVANTVKDLVEEALSLERKSQHIRITSVALQPLVQAAKAYTDLLPKAKRRA